MKQEMRVNSPVSSRSSCQLWVITCAWLAAASSLSADLHANSGLPSAGAVQNTVRAAETYYDRRARKLGVPQVPEKLVLTDTAPSEMAPSQFANEAAFWVARIVIPESKILPANVLADLAETYQARRVTLSDLQQLVQEINAAYQARHFVTARALLPQQTIRDGVVTLKLIEARIDEVSIVDNRFTDERYIRQRLNLAEGELADVHQLENTLLAFNGRQDIKLKALLQPGAKPYTTRYVLQAAEPDNHEFSVFTDNAGRETIGEERVGLRYTNHSLTGRRDRLTLGASYADGADAGFVSYSVPVNRYGTRAIVGVDYSQIVIVSGELETFNVRGKSTVASAYLSHPLTISPRGSLFATAGMNVKDSETDFDGVDQFQSSIRSFTLGAELQRFGNGFLVYARPRINFGVDDFAGDASFITVNGDAGLVFGFGPKHRLAVRVSGQWSDLPQLPSAEQFQLGGAASVRGYPEGFLIGDKGYFSSAEYRFSGFNFARRRQAIEPFVFIDHGGVFTSGRDRALNGSEYLTAAGIGATYRMSEKITANLQVGFPLSSRVGQPDDYAIHFHINFKPFSGR